MKKLFLKLTKENKDKLVDNEYYFIFHRCGELECVGNWERDNDSFYDSDSDNIYDFDDLVDCYAMTCPNMDQMETL